MHGREVGRRGGEGGRERVRDRSGKGRQSLCPVCLFFLPINIATSRYIYSGALSMELEE